MATGRIGVTPTLRTRWSDQPTAGTTVLSGLDDNSVALVYDVGYEAVYRNGVLQSRGNDYTATDGTTITLLSATLGGDIIEVFANDLVPLTDAISKGQYNAKGALLSATAASTPGVLAVGTNDQVLTADSTTATGLKWASPTGSAKNYTLVNAGGTSLSGLSTAISGLSSYDSLLVIIRGASANAGSQSMYMSVNNVVTASSYTRAGSNIKFPATYVNTMSEAANADDTEIRLGTMGNNAASQVSGGVSIDGCRGSGVKTLDVVFGTEAVGATANNTAISYKGVINATTAISSIEIFLASGTFDAGTLFVYGAV